MKQLPEIYEKKLRCFEQRAFAQNIKVSFRIFQVVASPKVIASYIYLTSSQSVDLILEGFPADKNQYGSFLHLIMQL